MTDENAVIVPTPSNKATETTKRPNRWDGLQGKLLLIIVTAALSILGTLVVGKWNNRLRSLTYYVQTTAPLIQRPDLGGKRLAVSVDGKPVENLSTVTVYLINPTDTDFDSVPVELYLSMPDGSPVELLQEDVEPKRLVVPAPTTRSATNMSRRYEIDVANRQTHNEGILIARYVFSGPVAPKVELRVLKKGVVATEGRLTDRVDNSDVWIVLGVIVVVCSFLVVLGLLSARRRKKMWEAMTVEARKTELRRLFKQAYPMSGDPFVDLKMDEKQQPARGEHGRPFPSTSSSSMTD